MSNSKYDCCNDTFTDVRFTSLLAMNMPWEDVCPSVRLSHASILSKGLFISSKFFSPSGSPIPF